MTLTRMLRGWLGGLALAALLTAPALARTEGLSWQHGDPSVVTGFRVHVGQASGSYQQVIDVGIPASSGGTFSHTITVPDGDDVYVAITAYDANGLESVYSNEAFRAAPPPTVDPLGQPGQPQPQP